MYSNNVFRIWFVFGLLVLFTGISTIPSTEGIAVEENGLNTTISGLYYLHDDDPFNYPDWGSLLRNAPLENEVTFCGAFVKFSYAEMDIYVGTYTVFNIYYHIWQKVPEYPFEGELFELGYSNSDDPNALMNESIMINTSEFITVADNYRLVQAMQVTNSEIAIFEGDEIYDFTIKYIGCGPRIRTNPNQYSFVILNLEDNVTLQNYDRDDDLINDFDELFVFYTNPFDSDSDNDGFSDYTEVQLETNPNDFDDNLGSNTHPNIPTVIGPLSGKAGKKYEYKFLSTDPESQDISFFVEWGDDISTYWTGYVNSETEVRLAHTWFELGTYTIKAKAKDIYGAESDWSDPLTVTITKGKSRVINTPFQWFLQSHPYLFPILQTLLQQLRL
jgi:hypothetical protein